MGSVYSLPVYHRVGCKRHQGYLGRMTNITSEEVKQLLEDDSLPFSIVPLPSNESGFPRLRWLSRWFSGCDGGGSASQRAGHLSPALEQVRDSPVRGEFVADTVGVDLLDLRRELGGKHHIAWVYGLPDTPR
jgi:hypothetical protein